MASLTTYESCVNIAGACKQVTELFTHLGAATVAPVSNQRLIIVSKSTRNLLLLSVYLL